MCRLRAGGGQRFGRSGGWQATGQDFLVSSGRGGPSHFSPSRVSRSLLPSFSWFEFFSPLHPLHAIFPSASAIRHQVMVMVIGGGQGGGGGARLQGGWGAPWTESGEHAVPWVYVVEGVGGGDPWQPVTVLSFWGTSSLLGVQDPFPPVGLQPENLRRAQGCLGAHLPPQAPKQLLRGPRALRLRQALQPSPLVLWPISGPANCRTTGSGSSIRGGCLLGLSLATSGPKLAASSSLRPCPTRLRPLLGPFRFPEPSVPSLGLPSVIPRCSTQLAVPWLDRWPGRAGLP